MKETSRLFRKMEEVEQAVKAIGIDLSSSSGRIVLPGLTDVHVHLREPGFSYKETIGTGTLAAAAGGFTQVCAMPNLDPVPDSKEHLQIQLDAIAKDACIHVYPYGAITVGEKGETLADLEGIADQVIAFTDDGKGVMSDALMREAMIRARKLGKVVVAHCEDERYPRESAEAEWKQLERDLQLVRETGCAYHMCHVSTEESVRLIRQAKEEGLDVTVETAPHYLVFSQETIQDHGRFKMNPPIKAERDRIALLRGLQDGTIDMIATDHAPHSKAEKEGGMAGAAYGIVGLETCVPVLYTYLVERGVVSLHRLVELLYTEPCRRFGLDAPDLDQLLESNAPTFTLWDMHEEYVIDPETFLTMGRSTPFEGMSVKGRCLATVVDGRVVYEREQSHGAE